MQSRVELQLWIIILIISLILVYVIYTIMRLHRLSKIQLKLKESNQLRGSIIDAYSNIRHEYNNIFQTVVNLLEAEEMEDLFAYKKILLDKVHVLGRNNMTQLGKIKTESVLNPVYQLYQYTQKEMIVMNITVYKEILSECPYEADLYFVMKKCIKSAIVMAGNEGIEVNLGIGENQQSLYFNFECIGNKSTHTMISETFPFEDIKLRKRLTYNTQIKDSKYVQELIISR